MGVCAPPPPPPSLSVEMKINSSSLRSGGSDITCSPSLTRRSNIWVSVCYVLSIIVCPGTCSPLKVNVCVCMYERVRINRDEKLLFWPVIYAALQYFCVCSKYTTRWQIARARLRNARVIEEDCRRPMRRERRRMT